MLMEMGDDLAGMGAGNLAYDEENNMMIRQPTSMYGDHAMMQGQPASAAA